jgi:hypothetical protein
MFLPPDPRNAAKVPAPNPANPSKRVRLPRLTIPLAAWPVLAGASFGAARFLIGLAFILCLVEPVRHDSGMSGVGELAWKATIAASVSAAVLGGIIWLFRAPVTLPLGAFIGFKVAIGSYLGIALYGVLEWIVHQDEKAANDAIMSAFCSLTSAVITGPLVFTILVLLGSGLSAAQKATLPTSQ